MNELDDLAARWRQARDAKLDAEEKFAKAEHDLVTAMADAGRKTATADLEDGAFKIRVVASETVRVNEPGLKKALGARLYNTLLKKSLDQSLLKKALADGKVDPIVVAQHSEVVPRKSYIKLTLLGEDPE